MDDDTEDTSDTKISEDTPLEVKVTNSPKKDVQWNDSKDDSEYDDLGITDEDKDI